MRDGEGGDDLECVPHPRQQNDQCQQEHDMVVATEDVFRAEPEVDDEVFPTRPPRCCAA